MSAEQQPQGPENNIETPKVSAEQYEKAEKNIEAKSENLESNEKSAEKARVEALETAISVEKGSAEKKNKSGDSPAPRRRGGISKHEKAASYKKRMKQIQDELPAPERMFSKLIHNPVVEKVSAVAGATIARPNAILSGAVVAFFLVLAVYLVAKNLGYPLSGFESIGAFIIGWVIGVLYDYFRIMVTGKK
jgi:hypothetical protein